VLVLDRAYLESDRPCPAGLLLGLADQSRDRGLGLLVGCPDAATVNVLTPVARQDIHRITPGSLCLDQSFGEIAVPMSVATRSR